MRASEEKCVRSHPTPRVAAFQRRLRFSENKARAVRNGDTLPGRPGSRHATSQSEFPCSLDALRRRSSRARPAAALPAAGAASGAGVGAGTDRGRVDCVAAFACDRNSAHWKLFAGYQLGQAVEVRAVWFDAGHFQRGDTTPLGTPFGGTFKVDGFAPSAPWSRFEGSRRPVLSPRSSTRADNTADANGLPSMNTAPAAGPDALR